MRKSREKENKSLLRVQDYTNDKRKLKTKAIPDYFPWPTAFMLTGPKKGLSFQANTGGYTGNKTTNQISRLV